MDSTLASVWLPTASTPPAQRSLASGLAGPESSSRRNDLGRAQLLQEVAFLGPAGRGDRHGSRASTAGDRHRADAAGRAGDDHRAALGADAVPFQRHDRQHRRVAGGADRHGVAGRHAVRQRHQPVAVDARPAGKGAVMRLADAPAVEHDLVAELQIGMRGGDHRAGEIDAGHQRKAAHDRRLAGDRQPVLVVDRRVFDRRR